MASFGSLQCLILRPLLEILGKKPQCFEIIKLFCLVLFYVSKLLNVEKRGQIEGKSPIHIYLFQSVQNQISRNTKQFSLLVVWEYYIKESQFSIGTVLLWTQMQDLIHNITERVKSYWISYPVNDVFNVTNKLNLLLILIIIQNVKIMILCSSQFKQLLGVG